MAWCGWALAAELAAPSRFAVLAVALATALLFQGVRAHAYRLLRRTRWLLLVLVLAYAWTLPGAPLAPAWGAASPSLEGLEAGAWRAARLALMLGGLAVLLATTGRGQLVYGFYALAAPLEKLGFDRRAFAVRLGLTLQYVEQPLPPGGWRAAFNAACAGRDEPTSYRLAAQDWQTRDSVVVFAAVLLVGVVWV